MFIHPLSGQGEDALRKKEDTVWRDTQGRGQWGMFCSAAALGNRQITQQWVFKTCLLHKYTSLNYSKYTSLNYSILCHHILKHCGPNVSLDDTSLSGTVNMFVNKMMGPANRETVTFQTASTNVPGTPFFLSLLWEVRRNLSPKTTPFNEHYTNRYWAIHDGLVRLIALLVLTLMKTALCIHQVHDTAI